MTKIKSGPFAGLKARGYRVITFDPPWEYRTYSAAGQKKSASRHYQTMGLQEIAALPVKELAHKSGCIFIMWTTWAHLAQSIEVLRWLGFRYLTGGDWVKLSPNGTGIHIGTGHHFRGSSEPYLIGGLGHKLPRRAKCKAISQVIIERVREHSRKPDQFIRNVEARYEGPYLELFSRTDRKGWTSWGLEAGKWRAE